MTDHEDDDLPWADTADRRQRVVRGGDEVNEILRGLTARFRIEDLPEKLPPPPGPTPIPMHERLRLRGDALRELGWPSLSVRDALAADEQNDAIRGLLGWPCGTWYVVLSGPVGVGKTVAAAWWSLRCSRHVRFVRATTLARTSRYDSDGWSELLHADALVVDDLGAEYADVKGSFLVDYDELVDTFVGDERPLIVTTNTTHHEFCRRYGERSADRLRHSGHWIHLDGPSLRGGR